MPKKKRNLKHHREQASKKRSFLPNPGPAAMAVVEEVAPAFAGYAAGRFAGRIAMKVGSAKLGKHAAPLASTVLAVVAYFLAHRVKKIAKYSSPLVVGSAIAALQTVMQAYLPKYSWLVSDPSLSQYAPTPKPVASGMADYETTRQRYLRPVGDEFDKLEQEAMGEAYPAAPPAAHAAPQPQAHTASAAKPVDIDPNEWEISESFNEDDFGSLSGGMTN